jgi:succinyl-CoA synthetase beta subunit
MSDPNVKSVLINIFGGIVRCDRIAQGVIDAITGSHITVPVVVRLEGTNADIAAKLLADSPLEFKVAGNFREAAEMAVAAAK